MRAERIGQQEFEERFEETGDPLILETKEHRTSRDGICGKHVAQGFSPDPLRN
jgi:hypothetical protein